jgi:predicted nucleotidyltransferase
MAAIPPKVLESVKQFFTRISSEIPVKKAVLFGSFAKGTFDKDSDVDLAIFSDYFENISRVKEQLTCSYKHRNSTLILSL